MSLDKDAAQKHGIVGGMFTRGIKRDKTIDKLKARIQELEKDYALCNSSFELLVKSEEAETEERIHWQEKCEKLETQNEKLRLRLVFMDHLWHQRNGHVQYRERCEDIQCCANAIALFGKPSMSVPERKQYDNDLKQALEDS